MYRSIDTVSGVSAPAVLAAILAVVIPWQLFRAHRFDEGILEHWADDHGVELTPENRPMVRHYLRKARLLRTWGGVAGATLPSLIDLVVNGRVQVLGFGTDGESAPLGFGTIFVGYLAGALVAELSLVRPIGPARRAARLAPRTLADYLPYRFVLAQRALAVVAGLGLLAIAVVPYPDSVSSPGLPSSIAMAAGVLAFAAGVEAVERWFVRRPQPFTNPALVVADDAIRGQSIRAVAASTLSLLLLLCCGLALGLQGSAVETFRATMVVPAVACLLLSLLACRDVSQDTWRVRRSAGRGAAASA
jgi:hypothetical protein